ncbi:MAG: xylulokinase [Mycobacterium leprae]
MLFIGIDVGTSGVRTIAVDEAGSLVAQATTEHPLHVPQPGWTEQDPQDWWNGAVQSLRQVVAALGQRAGEIAAVGLTGQMHGSVFLDEDGKVIRPAILWNDQRTVEEAALIEELIGRDRLIELTGNRALTGFTAPKIVWLRRHEPDNYARIAQILLPKDYIRYRLTGAYATDVADASGTLLFDVAHRRWSEEVCGALFIPEQWLPEACEGPEVTGTVTLLAAGLTGLPAGIPVVAGGGDQAAGAVGVGLAAPGAVSVSIGTSGVVFAATNSPLTEPEARLHSFCHAVPGQWHLMGVMLSAGGSLRWVRDTLYTPETGYDEIGAEAASVPPGAEGLLFAPYLTGERSPHADPFARGAYVGLGLHHRRPHMTRAAMEGIAWGLKDSLEIMANLGIHAEELRIIGGGAKGAVWRQIMAAIFNKPLRRMAIEEGPAFGAAILGAVGAGAFPDVATACAAMVRTADAEQPDPALAARYAELYPAFRALYPALKPLFGANQAQ